MYRTRMNHRMLHLAALCLVGLLVSPQGASALTVTASGAVADWGITPFAQGTIEQMHDGWEPASPLYRTVWREQNNYSPVNYPFGVGHMPSPGGSDGEMVDLEALYLRINTGLATPSLQVLLATSMNDHAYSSLWRRQFRLGDLFLDVDADNVLDFAVATTDWDDNGARPWMAYDPVGKNHVPFGHAAAPGSIFAIQYDPVDPIGHGDEVVTAIGPSLGGFGYDPAIEGPTRPWAVNQDVAAALMVNGQPAMAGLVKDWFDYGMAAGGGYYPNDNHVGVGSTFNEDGTYFHEWTIPLGWIDPQGLLDESTLDLVGVQITVECGNDVLKLNLPDQPGFVPEPLTALALTAGLTGLVGYLRRRAVA